MKCTTDCAASFSATDAVSVVLASAAFVVSVASLWFSSLRRPNVGVDRIAAQNEMRPTGWAGDMVNGTLIDLRFYVANWGASGTVVERLDVIDFREVNNVQPIWSGIVPGVGYKGVAFRWRWSATTRRLAECGANLGGATSRRTLQRHKISRTGSRACDR